MGRFVRSGDSASNETIERKGRFVTADGKPASVAQAAPAPQLTPQDRQAGFKTVAQAKISEASGKGDRPAYGVTAPVTDSGTGTSVAKQVQAERRQRLQYLSDATGSELQRRLRQAEDALSRSGGRREEDEAAKAAAAEFNAWKDARAAFMPELARHTVSGLDQNTIDELSASRFGFMDEALAMLGLLPNSQEILSATGRVGHDQAWENLRAKGYSDDQVRALREYVEIVENEDRAAEQRRKTAEETQSGVGGAILTNTAATLSAPARVLGLSETLRGVLPEWAGGYHSPYRRTDVNSPYFDYSRYKEDVSGATHEMIDNPVLELVYDAGTSALESAYNMALAGGIANAVTGASSVAGGLSGAAAAGGRVGGAAENLADVTARTMNWVMGSEVAASTVADEIQKGHTNEEALVLGIVRGAIEGFTEQYSVGDWLNEAAAGKNAARVLAAAAGAEGMEEVASNWLNYIVDYVAEPENARELTGYYQKYKEQGYDDSEALGLALLEHNGTAFLAGALSGLGMSGAAYAGGTIQQAPGNIRYNQALRDYGRQARTGETVTELAGETVPGVDEATAALIESGLESPEGTESRTLAEAAREKVQAGRELTDAERGRLAAANDAQIRAEADLSTASGSPPLSGEAGARANTQAADTNTQGRTANTLEMTAADRAGQVREIAGRAKLSEEGQDALAEIFRETAEEGQAPTGFVLGTAFYYQAGVKGNAFESVPVPQAAQVTPTQARLAYNAGRMEDLQYRAKVEREERIARENERNEKLAAGAAGLHEDAFTRGLSPAMANRINETARLLDTPVYVLGNGEIGQGLANGELVKGRAVLLEQSLFESGDESVGLRIAGHEWGHRIKALDAAAYAAFRDAVAPELTEQIQNKEYLYNERNGLGYSREQITEEAVNDRLGEMLRDGKILDQFIEDHRQDKGLLQRMWESIKAIARKLTGAEKRYAQSAEGKLRAALDAAATAARREAGTENAAQEGGESEFSVKEADELYNREYDFTQPMTTDEFRKLIKQENDPERYFPKGLSPEFLKTITKKSLFTRPKLYRGIEAAEFDFLAENGYLKSNSSYNFANQQGQTLADEDAGYALSYATGFAPKDIADKHYKDGLPTYLIEFINAPDLNVGKNEVQESYTYGEIDQRYITRVFEIMYDQETGKDMIQDVTNDAYTRAALPRLGWALSGLSHGLPQFYRDKTTGTILYAVQGADGYENGLYVSEKFPDVTFRYSQLGKEFKPEAAQQFFGVSGDEADLEPVRVAEDGRLVRDDGVRYSLKERDADYMAAVEGGDMETAQRMVDEAAKAAGYTDKVYHGTRAFGFTRFDTSKTDDGISIFATSDPRVAETYSGETERSRIQERSRVDVDSLRGERLLEEANKHLNRRYQDYRLMSEKDKEDVRKDARHDILMAKKDAQAFIDEHDGAFDPDKFGIVSRATTALTQLASASNEDALQEAWNDWQEAVWDFKDIDDSLAVEFLEAIGSKQLYFAKNHLEDVMYSGDMYMTGDDYSYSYVFDNQLALELDAALHKGVYALYGRPGKQLVIDADGANWNQIKPPDELNLYGPQRTRDIAGAAKANGYDSVLFKDLRDNGGETAYNGTSDVYIFFNANHLKSADPVTYDDDGNMIPLSERFNPADEDIRYHLREDSEGRELTEAQAAYFADSKAVDEDGRLLVMYHGSNADFTVFDRKKSSYSNLYGRGFYFTDSKEHAGQYGSARPYYLNIVHPLLPGQQTITKKQMRAFLKAVAQNEDDYDFVNYGQGATVDSVLNDVFGKGDFEMLQDVSVTAIGDLVAATELFNEVNGTEYDGFILPTETVVFRSNQAKRTDNLSPTGDQDIRYSLKEPDAATVAELRRENERLRARVEYWRGQTKQTRGLHLREGDLKRVTGQLVKDYSSTADKESIAREIGQLALTMRRSGAEVQFSQIKEAAERIASEIVSNAEELVNGEEYQSWRELKKWLRDTKISISAQDASGIPDFSAWKRSHRAIRVGIDNGGLPIDTAYEEMSGRFGGGFFPVDIANPTDQLERIAEVLDSFGPVYENPYSVDMAAAVDYVAGDILERVMDEETVRPTPPTRADRQAAAYEARIEEKDRQIKDLQQRAVWNTAQRIAQERAKRDRMIAEIKNHQAEVKQNERNRRQESQDRDRLLRVARRLNRLKTTAENRALIDGLIGDLDTVSKSLTTESIENLVKLREWYEGKTTEGSDSYDPDFIADKATLKKLQRLEKRQIKDLSITEVRELTEALLNIENELRTARKLIDSEDRRDVYLQAVEIDNHMKEAGGWNSGIISGMLSPERFARRITGYAEGDPLQRAMEGLSAGQRTMWDYQRRAMQAVSTWTGNKAFMRRYSGKNAQRITVTGTDNTGRTVTASLTPGMLTSLYLHSLNDDNMRHISKGGVVIPNWDSYIKGDYEKAFSRGTATMQLQRSAIRRLAERYLTAEDIAFARAISRYFNETSKEALGATAEKLNGYSPFNVDNYYPISVDSNFLHTDFDAMDDNGGIKETLADPGYAQERKQDSKPIMLRDANDVLYSSIRKHGQYVGMAIPVRNMNKLIRTTFGGYTEDGTRISNTGSLKKTINEVFGKRAMDYLTNLMKDVQGGRYADRSAIGDLLSKMRSNYAGAVLTLNAGVAIKQAASYPTAAAVTGYRALAKALAPGKQNKVDLQLVQKYTPLLWYRSLGYSSQEQGELVNKGKEIPKALNWIQAMDVWTTTRLWKAAEYAVRQEHKGLTVGSDGYYKAVAEVYNRIIEETQPNYAAMQRPEILRTANELTKTLNMFKTQPFQNFNILYDAIGDYQAQKRALSTAANDEARREVRPRVEAARRKLGRALTSQLLSAFVFAAMQFSWDWFRRKDDKYRDEDGNITPAAWLKGIGINMLGNTVGMVPFGSETLELMESITDKLLKASGEDPFFEQQFYGFDASVLESMTDLANSASSIIVKTYQTVAAALDSEKNADWEALARQAGSAAEDVAEILGIPVANVRKTLSAVAERIMVRSMGPYMGAYQAQKITTATTSSDFAKGSYEILWRAYNNDREAYDELYKAMVADGIEEDKIKSAMEKNLKVEQGVDNVKDLDQRYMNPEQQDRYDGLLGGLESSSLWRSASGEERGRVEDKLYQLVAETATEGSAGTKLQAKIDAAKKAGISESEYVLYMLALSMADEPSSNGNYGSYTNAEQEEAIRMLTGLTDAEKSWLWMSTHESDKNNPFK